MEADRLFTNPRVRRELVLVYVESSGAHISTGYSNGQEGREIAALLER